VFDELRATFEQVFRGRLSNRCFEQVFEPGEANKCSIFRFWGFAALGLAGKKSGRKIARSRFEFCKFGPPWAMGKKLLYVGV